ncbi:MAG: hypothetical protein RSG52_08195 [Terrisporobacter sp.]|uniref:hypothetical protein n=1 Tax=Terrisporobacter sp. TaxID=1965305 RepID=UPI002FC8A14F
MFKFKRFMWMIIVILLLGAFILAFKMRDSFISDTDVNMYINDKDISYELVEYEEDISKSFTKNEDISNIKELEDISPVIVKVKVDSKSPREMYEWTTLTKVIVEEVYKGELDKESIYIFEPFDAYSTNPMIYSLDGYNIMNEDSGYILFLRDMKDSNYTPNDTIYMPTTTQLSKFSVNGDKVIKASNYELKYSNVKKQDIISSNEKIINKYNNMKENVVNKYITE